MRNPAERKSQQTDQRRQICATSRPDLSGTALADLVDTGAPRFYVSKAQARIGRRESGARRRFYTCLACDRGSVCSVPGHVRAVSRPAPSHFEWMEAHPLIAIRS